MNQLHLPSTASTLTPVRVFLVEDSQVVREQIVETLSDIPGVVFAGFSDTEGEALGHLRQNFYDVVIFDIELKQGNGISLLRSLARTSCPVDNLKIIFSNNVSSAYRRVGQQYGVQYFFDKTSELPQLRHLLEQFTQGVNES